MNEKSPFDMDKLITLVADELQRRSGEKEIESPLSAKLCRVMADIKRVPKLGWNNFHKYAFTQDEDVVDAVRPIYARHGIAWWPSITKHTRTEHAVNEKGRKTFMTEVTLRVTFVDPDSGESRESDWPGTALDVDDKGLYKAITGALKYALLLSPMMASGDNPERESEAETTEAPQPTGDRCTAMLQAFSSVGVSRQQIETKYGCKAEALTPGQLDELKSAYGVISRSPAAVSQFFVKQQSAASKVLASLGDE